MNLTRLSKNTSLKLHSTEMKLEQSEASADVNSGLVRFSKILFNQQISVCMDILHTLPTPTFFDVFLMALEARLSVLSISFVLT